MVNMKKALTTITFGILVITMVLSLTGCIKSGLEGKWQGDSWYWEFSNGTYTTDYYGGTETSSYHISDDGTLFINREGYGEFSLKKVTIEEMKQLNGKTDTSKYYAYDDTTLLIMNSAIEYKKQ